VAEQPRPVPGEEAGGQAESTDLAVLVGERTVLLAALRKLPPRQRAVVVLRYWEDLTDTQIGSLLGCSPVTVRSQLSRALGKLRDLLREGDDT
jgi:RNA polymerase sigma factor (sigma-70 family)